MLGSRHVIGVDIDVDALQIAQQNCEQFEDLQVKLRLLSSPLMHSIGHPSQPFSHVPLL